MVPILQGDSDWNEITGRFAMAVLIRRTAGMKLSCSLD